MQCKKERFNILLDGHSYRREYMKNILIASCGKEWKICSFSNTCMLLITGRRVLIRDNEWNISKNPHSLFFQTIKLYCTRDALRQVNKLWCLQERRLFTRIYKKKKELYTVCLMEGVINQNNSMAHRQKRTDKWALQ